MDNNLLQKLKDWRRGAANLEGVEAFQVFANTYLFIILSIKRLYKYDREWYAGKLKIWNRTPILSFRACREIPL